MFWGLSHPFFPKISDLWELGALPLRHGALLTSPGNIREEPELDLIPGEFQDRPSQVGKGSSRPAIPKFGSPFLFRYSRESWGSAWSGREVSESRDRVWVGKGSQRSPAPDTFQRPALLQAPFQYPWIFPGMRQPLGSIPGSGMASGINGRLRWSRLVGKTQGRDL